MEPPLPRFIPIIIKMENKSVINAGENKYRHDWYQTDSHVVVTLFIKNVNKDNLKITFEEKE
ncbi:Protein SGT1-like protein, partial [Armadillidium vulgare]